MKLYLIYYLNAVVIETNDHVSREADYITLDLRRLIRIMQQFTIVVIRLNVM